MKQGKVVLVGFQDIGNLGIGYIAATLLQAAFQPIIVDYRLGPGRILRLVREHDPVAVGFSIISQHHTSGFGALMEYLRSAGVACHFTAGGHYPSLRPSEVLGRLRELDSIVMFEGERTMLALVEALSSGGDWRALDGVAFRNEGDVLINTLRPLEEELDRFSPPVRAPLQEHILGRKQTAILASRGCRYNCSFCSIRSFYSSSPGSLKRVRAPEMVVKEMQLLHEEHDCSIFLFHDDDFPGADRNGREWALRFCDLLIETGLAKEVMWKISCRCDEVEAKRFAMLREAGLCAVYLGIESGTDQGLRLMNKHIGVATSLRAVETLKRLQLTWDYGFILFDPMTTHETLLQNLDFLESICSDGSTPLLTGGKLIPYAETRIEKLLAQENRLRGRGEWQDYYFLDPALDHLYSFFVDALSDWLEGRTGVLNLSWLLRCYLDVCKKYLPGLPIADLEGQSRQLIARCNEFLLTEIRQLAGTFASGTEGTQRLRQLAGLRREIRDGHERYRAELLPLLARIEMLSGHRPTLM
jgi:anaerobic magnesium-protoporphyrin IX monomethyl ester cyclase